MDSYYQPPEPIREDEAEMECPSCERETWHTIVCWEAGRAEAECQECRHFTDMEIEDDAI